MDEQFFFSSVEYSNMKHEDRNRSVDGEASKEDEMNRGRGRNVKVEGA